MLIDPVDIASLSDGRGVRNNFSCAPAARDSRKFISHGLCDLQINGFAGVDYNDPEASPESIANSLEAMLRTGVTRCLPTVITADIDWQSRCFKALEAARASSPLASAMIAGYHLEGPFLNPAPGYSGCHPASDMRPAGLDYVERVQEAANGQIRLVTVAPEMPGVLALIPQLVNRGIRVAIGHSAADYDTLQRAIDAGACMSTHLGNGVASPLPKSDNTVLAQLSMDRLSAGFIADDYHIRRHVLQVYLRAKMSKNTILVTDGTAGSGAVPGPYTLGKIAIERQQEPVVYVPGTTNLAGSAATLDACVSNVCRWYGIDIDTAISWASSRARSIIGLSDIPVAGDHVEWVTWQWDERGMHVTSVQLGEYRVHTT